MGVELFVEAIALLFGGIAARWMFTQVRARAQEWMARRQLEALASEAHIVEPEIWFDSRPPGIIAASDRGIIQVVADGADFTPQEPEASTQGPTATDLIWRLMGFGLFTPRPRVISSAEPGSGRTLTPGRDALAWFFGMFSTRPKA